MRRLDAVLPASQRFARAAKACLMPVGASIPLLAQGASMTNRLLPTTVVGSYPQPEWLVDRDLLRTQVPRVRLRELWRVPEPYLAQAQDDATVIAIRDMERAGIDIVTDGEMRRESYSNRFATALDGIDNDNPATIVNRAGRPVSVPRVVSKVRRRAPVEVDDMKFLRRNTDRMAKITLPGPFTMAQQAKNEFYKDADEMVMDFAAAVNEEAHDLQAAGADVIQLDDPWLRNDPDAAKRIAVRALDRALQGLTVPTIVHLCFGYGAVVPKEKPTAYSFLPQLADSAAEQISIEAAQPRLDLGILRDFAHKTIVLGVLDLSDPAVETPEKVAGRIREGLKYVDTGRLVPAPDCGMKYLTRELAFGKLAALSAGAAIVRREVS
jgi:5-methyltetrahydropteroyltriglutamate--homocysteine methyltransferase